MKKVRKMKAKYGRNIVPATFKYIFMKLENFGKIFMICGTVVFLYASALDAPVKLHEIISFFIIGLVMFVAGRIFTNILTE